MVCKPWLAFSAYVVLVTLKSDAPGLKTDAARQVFGYEDANVPGGWNISTERQQLISSFMTLGAFLSSSMAGPIAGVMSRRMTVWVASILCIVSNVVMMATTNIAGLYAGRLLLGIANGIFITFSQLYIQVGHSTDS